MQTNMASYSSASRFNANYGANTASHPAGHRQNSNLKFGFVEPVSCSTVALGCCSIPCLPFILAAVGGLAYGAYKLIGSILRK